MFEIRQIIQRLRMGESARQIARSRHVGRAKVDSIHSIALAQNWLDSLAQIPDDSTLATFFKTPRKAPQNVSSVELFRDEILQWHGQGINATTIRRALHEKHGFTGSVRVVGEVGAEFQKERAEVPIHAIHIEMVHHGG